MLGKLFFMRSLKWEEDGFKDLCDSSPRSGEFRAGIMARGSVAPILQEAGADGSDGPSWPCNLCIHGSKKPALQVCKVHVPQVSVVFTLA